MTPVAAENPDALRVAREAAAAMEYADVAAREAGVRLVDVGPGHATTALTVTATHLNGHGICHGGYVFLLADAAFAYACNSFGVSTVAAGADVTFLRPGAAGEELVAEARRLGGAGRSGLYDVTVRAGDDVVAEFRGRSRTVPGLAAPPAPPT
ncbi:MAG: phenylacetic acid degradation protein PaaD [Pseudonocardia sp. SCN 72-86]|nr:MAG: phenylacetic acid degradation protein PaaD [Pseudonocardia sp. SCN 72-86]